MAKDKHCKIDKNSVLPLIKKKYLTVMILLIVLGVFLLSFFSGTELLVSYVFIALLLGACRVMYQDMYCFQKFAFKYRPFMMTQYFELVVVAGVTALIIHTIPFAQATQQWVPYGMLWFIGIMIWFQFRSMFWTAKNYKKSDPTKCEFC